MTAPAVWLNGEVCPASEARVSPFDHGLLVGDGVFETLRVYSGVPFAWTRHDDRLRRSAAGLGLAVPPSEELRAAADTVLRANGMTEARLRLTVTGGPAPLGSERGDASPTVIVAVAPVTTWPDAVDVVTAPWTRNERGAVAGLKTTSYAENVRALAYASARGGAEAILANTRGELCEATGSNVFVVRNGVLSTPPESAGCLLGVTRGLVIELCVEHAIPVNEATLPLTAPARADEAFLTSSTREVQPIARVDGQPLPGAPGALTAKLASLFAELIAGNPDP